VLSFILKGVKMGITEIIISVFLIGLILYHPIKRMIREEDEVE
jgi:hypothetical protein